MAITESADILTIVQYGDYETFVKKFKIDEINNKSQFGSSLLQHSISGKKFDISLFLIQNNIDVNISNLDGQTAIHYICVCPNYDVAKAILDKGGDINIRDKYGNNALWTAVFNCKGRYYDIVELFMRYNPDINTKNKAGRSPLDFAKQVGNEKLINILSGKGSVE